jgi:hypothetical protein
MCEPTEHEQEPPHPVTHRKVLGDLFELLAVFVSSLDDAAWQDHNGGVQDRRLNTRMLGGGIPC